MNRKWCEKKDITRVLGVVVFFLGWDKEGAKRLRVGWQRLELLTCSLRGVGRAAGGHSTRTFVEWMRVMKIWSQVAPELVTRRAAAVTVAPQLDCWLTRMNDGDFGTQQHTESKTIPWFIVNVRLFFRVFFLGRIAVGWVVDLVSTSPHTPSRWGYPVNPKRRQLSKLPHDV